MLAQIGYLHLQNQRSNIHQQLVEKYMLIDTYTPYYKYVPENKSTKLYCDRSIITDKTIQDDRPDIVLAIKI